MSQSDHAVEAATTSPVPSGIVESPVNQWLLVDANRWLLAALLSAGVFAVFFGLGLAGVIGVTAAGPAPLLLSVLVTGNLTLVTITITINQLVLSREFGRPHELRTRDEGVRQLRERLVELADVGFVRPGPEAFLRVLVESIDDHADQVEAVCARTEERAAPAETADGETPPVGRLDAASFRDRVDANTGRVRDALDRSDFGSFDLLSALLHVNSAWLIAATEQLREQCPPEASDEPFDRMEEILRLFNVSRQYTKTLYMQKEIATLSRLLLYVGFLGLLVPSATMLLYGRGVAASLPSTGLLAVFSLAGAVAFAPLAFLLSYTLRVSTLVSFAPLRNSFITNG